MDNPNKIEKKTASHIRAYCVKEDLQRIFFTTNIKVYAFDPKLKVSGGIDTSKESIVVIVYKTAADQEVIKQTLGDFIDKNGSEFRDIMVHALVDGDDDLEKYKNGDF